MHVCGWLVGWCHRPLSVPVCRAESVCASQHNQPIYGTPRSMQQSSLFELVNWWFACLFVSFAVCRVGHSFVARQAALRLAVRLFVCVLRLDWIDDFTLFPALTRRRCYSSGAVLAPRRIFLLSYGRKTVKWLGGHLSLIHI